MLENAPVVMAATAEDEARQLLQAAAEIEHALLIEYLYAAFSLKSSPARKTLINIAVQEMSHLIAVQNLLLFLGAGPYLERQDVSPNPDLDPFPFGLNGYRKKETLERFVLAEMPVLETLKADDQAIVEEIQKRLDPQSKFHRVGVLYGRIYWLFQTSSAPEGDWKDVGNVADIGPLPQWHIGDPLGAVTFATTQASRSERGPRFNGSNGEIWWQDYGRDGAFRTIDTRQAALRAIYDIAVQGEGLATLGLDSHFHLFFNALKRHGDLEPGDFYAVPENPGTSAEDGRTEISDPVARVLCDLLNKRYQILLVTLFASLHLSRAHDDENEQRQKLIFWAFFEMKYSIPKIAAELVLHPCKAAGNVEDLCAAPTFELGSVELSGDIEALGREIREMHVDARQSIDALLKLGFGVDDDFVAKIDAADRDRYPDI
ncbi:ferritin-like protein [Mesorhizobium sp. M1060]|uniref:ferritin-like domain-containing protein n=1 Tax=Mesorhizobium sp. M1060 TaxID=2957052 RepID=UPI003338631A